jgi:predicted nucleic acid-binding protein
MIVADTSVWVDFLKGGSPNLGFFVQEGVILMHELIECELSLWTPPKRHSLILQIRNMDYACIADNDHVLEFIEDHQLMGKGIGYVDCNLLASCTGGNTRHQLWTLDKRLREMAIALGINFDGK